MSHLSSIFFLLFFPDNELGEHGAKVLAEALSVNSTIKTIRMRSLEFLLLCARVVYHVWLSFSLLFSLFLSMLLCVGSTIGINGEHELEAVRRSKPAIAISF